MVYTCPLCKSTCHGTGNKIVCYNCAYALNGPRCMSQHKRITKAMELLEGLEWLKNHELNLSFKQDSKGVCTIWGEDTGEKVTGNIGVLKIVKKKLQNITPNIIDLWG